MHTSENTQTVTNPRGLDDAIARGQVDLSPGLLRKVEKPARYVGGEFHSIIKTPKTDSEALMRRLRFCFCFPDTYEVGMSNLALHIIYGLLNERDDVWCERSFTPWVDMEEELRSRGLPLFALESKDGLKAFDVLGFTLPFELSFTNVLNMLDLADIPLRQAARSEDDPLIIGGGPVVFNSEPIADFFDLFVIGESEEVLLELVPLLIDFKVNRVLTKSDMLIKAAQIEGVYVPSLYDVTYQEDGTIEAITAQHDAPTCVKRRFVQNFDEAYFPTDMMVPNLETVHDRAFLELFRGCPRGCRFCQAGMIYRPVREKSPQTLTRQADQLIETSGYDEVGMLSLSTSDYSDLGTLTDELLDTFKDDHVSLSLPSLRLDSFSFDLLSKVNETRKSGLTFAPEAGSQRLRDVINKGIEEKDLLDAMELAFRQGYKGAKLYFMLGLPSETLEDVDGIADLCFKILRRHSDLKFQEGLELRTPELTVSCAMFIPKPFTPFQWVGQATLETLNAHHEHLMRRLRHKRIRYNWHGSEASHWEAVLARGDRRLSYVLERGFKMGAKFDGWSKCFDYGRWMDAMAAEGLDPTFYANRKRDKDEILPWDVIDAGVRKSFLWREWTRAQEAKLTIHCGENCAYCGMEQSPSACCLQGQAKVRARQEQEDRNEHLG